jgi:hypothetical protein
MRGEWARFPFTPAHFRIVSAIASLAVLAVFLTIAFAPPAQALPSFARQTGQPCGACHTDFPTLTPYGRRFKLLGYTTGGGRYQTTPFPTADDTQAKKEYVPPISMMTIVGYTHTQAPLPPPTAPFNTNDNVVLSPFSGFWGGAITDNIGAFAQVTYNGPGPGGSGGDPFTHDWSWDNTDLRYANSGTIGNTDVIFGLTANNNPTVQDVWNTTPAWRFPYAVSNVASTPGAGTIIEGAFAAHVGSAGAYAFIDDMLYLEVSAYRTLGFNAQNDLGVDPFDAPGQFSGVAPYWRVAFEPHWGNNSLMVGTFGMHADVQPWTMPGTTTTTTFSQTDKYTDIGFDSQYQYQGSNYWLTLSGSYIREYQKLDASFVNGLSANPTNELNTLHLLSSFAYGGDNRVVFTAQYFNTWGTSDITLYSGLASGSSPNSSGWIAEIAYIPFGISQAPGWPWLNARIGLDYIAYTKFDGTSVGASSNNTLFLSLWLAM